MAILRMILVSIICLGFIFYLGKKVISGLKYGVVHHTDSVKVFRKQNEPVKFWLIMILFSVFVLLAFFVWGFSMLAALG